MPMLPHIKREPFGFEKMFGTDEQRAGVRAAATPAVAPAPRPSLVGPDTITGLVREITIDVPELGKVRLWNDPMNRCCRASDDNLMRLLEANKQQKAATVTIEKLRGHWTVTKVEEAK